MTLDCEIVVTRSGAKAVRDRLTGELMHPVVGPAVESQRLYIAPSRLEERLRESGESLVLLDVGLGAASNAIAAWSLAHAIGRRHLTIVSFDRSTAALELALEHGDAFGLAGDAASAARALLDRGVHESPHVSWRLALGDLLPMLAREPAASADVVFWDPFSPKANPDLWTLAAFTAVHRLCRDGATLHTYSRATAVRSALLLAGFAVGEGVMLEQGRRTTEAAMHARDLREPLERRFLERLGRSSAAFPVDAPPDALDRVSRAAQFR